MLNFDIVIEEIDPIQIDVTQEHIDEATKNRLTKTPYRASTNCPIALALQDKYPEETPIIVYVNEIYIGDSETIYNSIAVQHFIEKWDAELEVHPFTFFI